MAVSRPHSQLVDARASQAPGSMNVTRYCIPRRRERRTGWNADNIFSIIRSVASKFANSARTSCLDPTTCAAHEHEHEHESMNRKR